MKQISRISRAFFSKKWCRSFKSFVVGRRPPGPPDEPRAYQRSVEERREFSKRVHGFLGAGAVSLMFAQLCVWVLFLVIYSVPTGDLDGGLLEWVKSLAIDVSENLQVMSAIVLPAVLAVIFSPGYLFEGAAEGDWESRVSVVFLRLVLGISVVGCLLGASIGMWAQVLRREPLGVLVSFLFLLVCTGLVVVLIVRPSALRRSDHATHKWKRVRADYYRSVLRDGKWCLSDDNLKYLRIVIYVSFSVFGFVVGVIMATRVGSLTFLGALAAAALTSVSGVLALDVRTKNLVDGYVNRAQVGSRDRFSQFLILFGLFLLAGLLGFLDAWSLPTKWKALEDAVAVSARSCFIMMVLGLPVSALLYRSPYGWWLLEKSFRAEYEYHDRMIKQKIARSRRVGSEGSVTQVGNDAAEGDLGSC